MLVSSFSDSGRHLGVGAAAGVTASPRVNHFENKQGRVKNEELSKGGEMQELKSFAPWP